jgi:hypothetical protein
MELTKNSYGYNVPKYDYEKLQNEVKKRNEIRMKALIEFNKVLDKAGLDTIGLDGIKPAKELTKTESLGEVQDVRIERLPPLFKNPYDISFEGMSEEESFDFMEVRLKEFYALDVNKIFNNIALNMKREFENKVEEFATRSINPIRYTLLNKIKDMNLEEFIKIYFSWYNNIAGENEMIPNFVINQWAWYFDVKRVKEYDVCTDEDMDEAYKNVPKYFQDEEDKQIRQHYYGYFN